MILFTGFDSFGEHLFNPSDVVGEVAANVAGASYELLGVDFETARVVGVSSRDYELVVHLGLASATEWVRLERFAHNIRMATDDPSQERDPDAVVALDESGPLALETSFPVGVLRQALCGEWDVRHSRDAGTYVCNATYYWSLRLAPRTTTVFVHVPAWSAEDAASFGRLLGETVAEMAESLVTLSP